MGHKKSEIMSHINIKTDTGEIIKVKVKMINKKTLLTVNGLSLGQSELTKFINLQIASLFYAVDKNYKNTKKLIILFQGLLSSEITTRLKRVVNSYLDGISQHLLMRLAIFNNEDSHNARYSACLRASLISVIFETQRSREIRDLFNSLTFANQTISSTSFEIPDSQEEMFDEPIIVKLCMNFFKRKYSQMFFKLEKSDIFVFLDKNFKKQYPLDKLYLVFLALMRLMINDLSQFRENCIIWVAILCAIFTRFDQENISTKIILDDIDGYEFLLQSKLSQNCSASLLRLVQCMFAIQDAKATICLKISDTYQMLRECYQTCILTVPYWEPELREKVLDSFILKKDDLEIEYLVIQPEEKTYTFLKNGVLLDLSEFDTLLEEILTEISNSINVDENDVVTVSYLVVFYFAVVRVMYTIIGPEFLEEQINNEQLIDKLENNISNSNHLEWYSQIRSLLDSVANSKKLNYQFMMGCVKSAFQMRKHFMDELFKIEGNYESVSVYTASIAQVNEDWYQVQIDYNFQTNIFAFCPNSPMKLYAWLSYKQTGGKCVELVDQTFKAEHFYNIFQAITQRITQNQNFNLVTVLIETSLVLWLIWKMPMSREDSNLTSRLTEIKSAVTWNTNQNLKNGLVNDLMNFIMDEFSETACKVYETPSDEFVKLLHEFSNFALEKVFQTDLNLNPDSESTINMTNICKFNEIPNENLFHIHLKTTYGEKVIEYQYNVKYTDEGIFFYVNGEKIDIELRKAHKTIFVSMIWVILDEITNLALLHNLMTILFMFVQCEMLESAQNQDRQIPGLMFDYSIRGACVDSLMLAEKENLAQVHDIRKANILVYKESTISFEYILAYFLRLEDKLEMGYECVKKLIKLFELQRKVQEIQETSRLPIMPSAYNFRDLGIDRDYVNYDNS